MGDDEKLKPPKPGTGDKTHAAVRAALSAIPWAGGAAVEIFQGVIAPPLQRRQAEWMDAVAEELTQLRDAGRIDFDALGQNEAFISATIRATEAARRTHQQEKLVALRNAVLNAALGQTPDDAQTQMYLNLIDQFTEWHLRVLSFAQAPPLANNVSMGSLATVVDGAFPALRDRNAFRNQIWSELFDRGLVNTQGLQGMMSANGLQEKRTTESGDEFLSLIRAPAR